MRVLFGIHNWGLGHATRDIVLIDEILRRGHSVDIISSGRAMKILKERYRKSCRYFDVPDLYPLYMDKRFSNFKFAVHITNVIKSLKQARKISEKIIARGRYDKVISDCRMDVYDREDNSYLINHQIRFNLPFIFEDITEKLYAPVMRYYRYIIVPDSEKNGLSGKLSHDLKYIDKKRIRYIGILSFLKKQAVAQEIDYFISLSGPEFARKDLEKKMLSQVKGLRGKIVIAGGNPDSSVKKANKHVTFYSYLNQAQQEEVMNAARFVIARGGYTTIMELVELEKKGVLLIPCPNQSEQEYLAELYEKKKWFHHVSQRKVNLVKDIETAKRFQGYVPEWKTNESVKKFLRVTGIY
jgi:UDP:flavonoid glycosyltransferase YjiC (YdhE family)